VLLLVGGFTPGEQVAKQRVLAQSSAILYCEVQPIPLLSLAQTRQA
jgi:hypothetical protein